MGDVKKIKKIQKQQYFLIRRYNCGISPDKITGKINDIIGITTDEKYAKNMQNVFCDYEEVHLIS